MDTEKLKELLTGITAAIKPDSGQDCIDVAGLILATGLAYADVTNSYVGADGNLEPSDASALIRGLLWLTATTLEDSEALSKFLDVVEKLLTRKAATVEPEQAANLSIQLCGFLGKHAAAVIVASGEHTPEEAADLKPKLAGTIQRNCVYVLMQSILRYYAARLKDEPQNSSAEPEDPNPSPGSSMAN